MAATPLKIYLKLIDSNNRSSSDFIISIYKRQEGMVCGKN